MTEPAHYCHPAQQCFAALMYTSGEMDITRRRLLGLAAAAPFAVADAAPAVKLGIDLFSLRSQNWTPFQLLDYSAAQKAKVVHFSEIRFIGSLEPENLRAVRKHAEALGIQVEIGMRSICPTSKLFDTKAGTAEEQIGRMIDAAKVVGSSIVRAVLGSSEDRKTAPIEKHIESTVAVLRAVRSRVQDANLKIAIENHSGDMQGHELKQLIEAAGKEFVGACLDSGNPAWTLEDPHITLEALHPYVLTSHVRDSAVWRVPEGIAVAWVRMGEGNVDIAGYCRKYAELCSGRALSLESIVTGPRVFATRDAKFWEAYRDIPAWEYERFLQIAEKGAPRPAPAKAADAKLQEREDLEASIAFTRKLLGL
jgi:sugar phosphate isomerase/epimerase